MSELINSLCEQLYIPSEYRREGLNKFGSPDNRFLKDLKINVNNVLGSNTLTRKEAYLLALAVSANQKSEPLIQGFETLAKQQDATDEEIAEVYACTSLMNANNVFYRFRHYVPSVRYYHESSASIRMSIMANPLTGKEFFELMSLVISSLNGCEVCVSSHEASVKKHGASEDRVFDAIRLAAVIKSLTVII